MPDLHFEDALNFLIDQLARVPEPGAARQAGTRRAAYGSDIWIDTVAKDYWGTRGHPLADHMSQEDKEPYSAAFYDAAWDLSRRGVLRPAAAVPDGQVAPNHMGVRSNAAPFFGDGYSLTTWGRGWIKAAITERAVLPSSPSRITEVLHKYAPLFGSGYAQRATEAVADWRTGNYLSACVMAGAAAESILLATAIQKIQDQTKVLSIYDRRSGRHEVAKLIRAKTGGNVGERFEHALGILTYWRDAAGHGRACSIGEIEAHEAISGLLRLARFTEDNWQTLTS
jgi:hypothetical protein